jgi:hypothetical protein
VNEVFISIRKLQFSRNEDDTTNTLEHPFPTTNMRSTNSIAKAWFLLSLVLSPVLTLAATIRSPPADNGPQSPPLNLIALTDGSLGDFPVQMLLLNGILAEMNSTIDASTPSSNKQDDKKKKKQDEQNGALAGGVMGGALAAGLANAKDGPAAAICNALAAGAGSAIGAKTGDWVDGAYPPKHNERPGEVNTENQTSTKSASNSPSSTLSVHASESSTSNHLGESMVSPFASRFVSGSVSSALSKGICNGIFKDLGKAWIPRLAEKILPPDIYRAGIAVMQKAVADGSVQVLSRTLEQANVPMHRVVDFVNSLESNIERLSAFSLDGATEMLQSDLMTAASQISDAIAAGQGSAIGPALGAVNQLGSAMGMVPNALSAANGALSPLEQFEGITQQLSNLNSMASSLSSNSAFRKQAQPVIDALHSAVSNAVRNGAQNLKGVGAILRGALGSFAPHHSGGQQKVHDITKTHHITITKYETSCTTKTDQPTRTKTHHVTETDYTTATDRVTKTKTTQVKETQLATKTRFTTVKVPVITLVTKTKNQHSTGVPSSSSWGWSFAVGQSGTDMICEVGLSIHFSCFGSVDDPIEYQAVYGNKYEKCLESGHPAHCFDHRIPTGSDTLIAADFAGHFSGVACAAGASKVQCWGTPMQSTVRYWKLNSEQLDTCKRDYYKCRRGAVVWG